MPNAIFVGGPRDGEEIYIDQVIWPIKFALPSFSNASKEESSKKRYNVVKIVPTLTPNGWRLYWPYKDIK